MYRFRDTYCRNSHSSSYFFWPGNFRLYEEKKALMSADDELHILDVENKKDNGDIKVLWLAIA